MLHKLITALQLWRNSRTQKRELKQRLSALEDTTFLDRAVGNGLSDGKQ